MISFFFTLALLGYFSILGTAFQAIFPPRTRVLQSHLIAPTIGISIIVLLVFFLNRLGIPVKVFGGILSTSLLVISSIIIIGFRTKFPLRKMVPYILIIFFAIGLAASPMFSFGFDWISFANDDMANYSLGAQRFYENGFFAAPDMEAFFRGKDYSQAFWFMHVLNNTRSGSELLLADVWAATGINPHRAFMPVIFALHGALILASAALVAGSGSPKRAPILTAILVAISPMTTLGALYQLIAQVGGLALLSAGTLLLCRPVRSGVGKLALAKRSASAVLVCASLFVFYPEVIPFLCAGFVTFTIWTYITIGRKDTIRVFMMAMLIGLALILLLNTYIVDALSFLQSQASGGTKQSSTTEVLFPYFLIPSGMAVAWGLAPIAMNLQEPMASLLVLVALFIYIVLTIFLIRQLKGTPSAAVSVVLVMMAVGSLLFARNNDFGLFKLVMFMQPFVFGVLSIGLLREFLVGSRKVKKFLVFVFAIFCMVVQHGYVEKSTGKFLGSLAELPHTSQNATIRDYHDKHGMLSLNADSGIVLNTSHIVMAKLQALYTRGDSVIFPSRQFFVNFIEGEEAKILSPASVNISAVESYTREKKKYIRKSYLATEVGQNGFLQVSQIGNLTMDWDLVPGAYDVFNLYGQSPNVDDNFFAQSNSSERLNFIHSDLGQHYYLGKAGNISYYSLENDPMFPGRKFAGFGRHFIFSVQSKDTEPRIVVELTSTLTKQFESLLPDVKIQDARLGFIGRGSGRIFSSPIQTSVRNGEKYIAVDMGRTAVPMKDTKSGIMRAYGRDIRLDRRLLTTFGRDISLISNANFEKLKPPANVSKFPIDLNDPNLEFSGIYEDGWVSENSFFVLSAEKNLKKLVINGGIPLIKDPNYSSRMTVSIDGKAVAVRDLGLGDFNVEIPVVEMVGRHRVDVLFSKYQQLPGEDGRYTAGFIKSLGFY